MIRSTKLHHVAFFSSAVVVAVVVRFFPSSFFSSLRSDAVPSEGNWISSFFSFRKTAKKVTPINRPRVSNDPEGDAFAARARDEQRNIRLKVERETSETVRQLCFSSSIETSRSTNSYRKSKLKNSSTNGKKTIEVLNNNCVGSDWSKAKIIKNPSIKPRLGLILTTYQWWAKINRQWWKRPFATKVDAIVHQRVLCKKKKRGEQRDSSPHVTSSFSDAFEIGKFKIGFERSPVRCFNVVPKHAATSSKRNVKLNWNYAK